MDFLHIQCYWTISSALVWRLELRSSPDNFCISFNTSASPTCAVQYRLTSIIFGIRVILFRHFWRASQASITLTRQCLHYQPPIRPHPGEMSCWSHNVNVRWLTSWNIRLGSHAALPYGAGWVCSADYYNRSEFISKTHKWGRSSNPLDGSQSGQDGGRCGPHMWLDDNTS